MMPTTSTIGVPLINTEAKRAIGAVSFTFSSAEYTAEAREQKCAKIVTELARRISGTIPIG